MIEIDFRDVPLLERLVREVGARLREESPRIRIVCLVAAALASIGVTELLRLEKAMHAAVEVERRRTAVAVALALSKRKVENVLERRQTLISLLRLRAGNAAEAATIARVGNAVRPTIALTALRRVQGGIEIEGRGSSVKDIASTISQLSRSSSHPNAAFTLHRDGGTSGDFWFSLSISMESGKDPR